MSTVSINPVTSNAMSAPAPEPGVLSSAIATPVLAPEANAKAAGISVTEKALKKIALAMRKEGINGTEAGLRLGITGGGCSGLSYSIRFDSKPRERDRVWEFEHETERVRVFVDPKSFIYLTGMILDFEETLMRQGFNFINPNSQKSCGCGSSFTA
ncbi:HesB/IscA family protein [Terriglobus tenax]|uniref:HesB/IscA family protein n=1 Tax=Terriglobus tenax TaxID=1111115 RepID=UPI0021DFD9E0|nr:iron-sulfur cluster assembly accessory protein [Terriglobus tenax]